MKKFMWLISMVGMLGLINCGGSSEAKELLQRILRLVGIPQTIVVNICQDKNINGICELSELQEKVSIKKGERVSSVLNKITQTAEGRYLLDTASPELPLLLVLQDNNSQDYTKEFTVPFTGLEATQTEKDLSLLQAMVDAGYLIADDIVAVETMKNQELFYQTLLKDFELNLKTLTDKELSSPRAVLLNLQEVATELKDAGIDANLTTQIDTCGDDVTCVETLMKETIITEDEAVVIVNNETIDHKKRLASKVVYHSYTEENQMQIEKVTFSSEADSLTWLVTKGVEEGLTGSDSVIVDGNKLTVVGEDTFKFLVQTVDYEFYENSSGEKKRYFFDEDKAVDDYNAKSIKALLAGKTIYRVFEYVIESTTFNSSMTSATWENVYGEGTEGQEIGNKGTFPIRVDGNAIIIEGERFIIEEVTKDYIIDGEGKKSYFSLEEAKEIYDSATPSNSTLSGLFAGKTLYKPDYHDEKHSIAPFTFNNEMTKFTIKDEEKNKTFTFDMSTTDNSFLFTSDNKERKYTMTSNTNVYVEMDYRQDGEERVSETFRFYFNREKAIVYMNTLN